LVLDRDFEMKNRIGFGFEKLNPFISEYQPNSAPPKMLLTAPLMVIYKKKLCYVYISRPNGLQNKIF